MVGDLKVQASTLEGSGLKIKGSTGFHVLGVEDLSFAQEASG